MRVAFNNSKMNILANILTPLPTEVCDIIYEYYKLPFLRDLIECFKNKEQACRRLIKYHKVTHGRQEFPSRLVPGEIIYGSYLIAFPKRYLWSRSNHYNCVFGCLRLGGKFQGNELVYDYKYINLVQPFPVIEILMKEIKDKRMKGSYWTIGELKQFCKMNKIKGYSKLDKTGLIRALMKI